MFARHALALAALVVVTWATSLHSGYVHFDTPWLVADNPILSTGDLSWLPAIVADTSLGTRMVLGAEYLPVRDVTVLLDFAVFGDWWMGHHLVNLGWYLAGCVLWLWLCRRLLPDPRLAFLAAALYAVHPTHVESVAWLASRKDVVSLALYLGAIVTWWRGGRGGWAASVLLFGLAYWAKNTAITLPAVLVLLSLLARRERPTTLRWLAQWIPHGLVALLGLAVTLRLGQSVSMMAPERADTAWGLVRIEAQVIARYLEMLVAPRGLSALYVEPAVDGPAWIGLSLIAALLAAAAACWRARPLVSLGILWFFVTLLPVSQIIPIQNLMADRYLLLPSAGAILAAVALVPAAALRRPAGLAAAVAVVAVLGGVTAQRNLVWTSDVHLWEDTVEKQPDLDRGWLSYAAALEREGEGTRAAAVLAEGLARLPDSPLLVQSHGLRLLEQGDPRAEAVLREAIARDSGARRAANALVVLLHREGRLEESVAVGQQLVTIHPLYVEGWNSLGAACIDARELDCADRALQRAQALAPMDARVWVNLGNLAYLTEDRAGAQAAWEEALRLEPGNDYARRGLAHLRGD